MTVYSQIKRDLLSLALVAIGLTVVQNWLMPRDSCDTAELRCGMKVRTDALSGCQYLESEAGALTVRLGRDGHQICAGYQ